MSTRSRGGTRTRAVSSRTSPGRCVAAVDVLDAQPGWFCTGLGRRRGGRQHRRRQYRRHGCEAPHVPSRDRHGRGASRRVITELRADRQNWSHFRRTGPNYRGVLAMVRIGCQRGGFGILPLTSLEELERRGQREDPWSQMRVRRISAATGWAGCSAAVAWGRSTSPTIATLDRDVAIKFVAPKGPDEARAGAAAGGSGGRGRSTIPYICAVYEAGETTDGPRLHRHAVCRGPDPVRRCCSRGRCRCATP